MAGSSLAMVPEPRSISIIGESSHTPACPVGVVMPLLRPLHSRITADATASLVSSG